MTNVPNPPRLRLTSPVDVLSAVPYLLGFHPTDSVVVLGLRCRRLVFHARTDLPEESAPQSAVAVLAHQLLELLRGQRSNAVIAVGYGTAARVTPLVLAVGQAMRSHALRVYELLRVTDGRYWSYECDDPACCPPDGVQFDVATSRVAAQATFAGFTALPDRAALVKTLAAPAGAALAASEAAGVRAHQTITTEACLDPEALRSLDAALGRYAAGGRLDDDEVALLAARVDKDRRLRDLAWEGMEGGQTPITVHAALWTDVVRRCDPTMVVASAVLLAYACWLTGDGVRSGIAVERALAVDPNCSAALLIAELLARAVPPPVAGTTPLLGDSPGKAPRARKGRRR
jgi:hypothetical protein